MSDLDPKMKKQLIGKMITFSGLMLILIGMVAITAPDLTMDFLGVDKQTSLIIGCALALSGLLELIVGRVLLNRSNSF